jgi:hypothetical protein
MKFINFIYIYINVYDLSILFITYNMILSSVEKCSVEKAYINWQKSKTKHITIAITNV